MDRVIRDSLDIAFLVHRLSEHIKNAPQRSWPYGDHDRRPGCFSRYTALETIRGVHRQGADPVIAKIFLHFKDKRKFSNTIHVDRLEKIRDLSLRKFDIHDTTKNLYHAAYCFFHKFLR